MKPHAEIMKQARQECIKILNSNPECTERDFDQFRPVLNNNDIVVRPLTTKPLYTSQELNTADKMALIYSLVDEEGIIRVGSIPDLANQLNVSYNLIYNTTRGMSSKRNLKTNLIDFVPILFTCKQILIYDFDKPIYHTLTEPEILSYGETCVKYNIHTSDLWELIDNGQLYKNKYFALGETYV